MSETTGPLAGLEARYAALRQAARSRSGDPGDVLEAAFSELEAAIDLLRGTGVSRAESAGDTRSDNAERGLLRAVFQDAPVPLFLVTRDGVVQRVNRAAGDMIGAKPGYATGRPFTAFVALPSRAAVNSLLTAVGRTGKPRQIRCSLVAANGLVPCELVIARVGVKGNQDDSDPLLVAVRDAAARPAPDEGRAEGGAEGEAKAKARPRSQLSAVQAVTRRLDLVTAVARLLLENEGYSESRMLQRCARLIARELTAWVIVDMDRGHRVRRQYVTGPDDPRLTELTSALAAVDPPPGSVPFAVRESGHPALVAHAEDAAALGSDLAGEPLLTRLDATSLLSVPLTDGEIRYGVLTLARRASDGHFKVADLALVQELGEQMGLAIRVDRMFRRRSEVAEALQASLMPANLPDVPWLEFASAYIGATQWQEISGDFYDVFPASDGWALAIGDVCGKGQDAAAMTAAARHSIRALSHVHDAPADVLAAANQVLLAGDYGERFVTTSLAFLRQRGRRVQVRLAGCGHPGPAVVRADGRVEILDIDGMPLGLFGDSQARKTELELRQGDLLFFYTDGVTEARSADHGFFEDRLADELASVAGRSAAETVRAVQDLVTSFSDGELRDDVTMLAVRVGP